MAIATTGHRRFRLVDVDIELFWDADLQAVGENLFADAPMGNPGGHCLVLRRTADGYLVDSAGVAGPACRTPGEVFQDAEMTITEVALDSLRHRYLPVHGAAVAHQGVALLIIGAHDAGKTSLGCALACSGASLLSDEVAPVDPVDLIVSPFPRDLILHEGTCRSLGRLPPSPGFKCFDGYRYLPPSAVGTGPPPAAVPVGGLLFPVRESGAQPVLRPQNPARSAQVLLQQFFDLEGLGGERAIDCVSRLVQLPAAAVAFSSAMDVVELVWRWRQEQVDSEVQVGVVG
ncbi:MAG: hypothetical protein O2782_04535 [bacterium]|nr:hypothetical protein [bacterium]